MNALTGIKTGGWQLSPASMRRDLAGQSLSHDSSFAVADRVDLSGTPGPVPQYAPSKASNQGYYDGAGDSAECKKYYGDSARFNSMSPAQLFEELSGLVKSTHKPLDYDPERYLYPEVDRHEDGQIYCIYSGEGPKQPTDAPGLDPLKEGEYNCEHVVPQSWFGKKHDPRGDLHHLYSALSKCNSLRGNAQYDLNVDSGQTLQACGIYDPSHNLFSPHAGQGETARSVLYFMLRYPGLIGDRQEEYGVNDLPMLLQWSNENPPTEYEKHRNQDIEKLQGNRNPLVDFPQLANKIDFTRGIGKEGRGLALSGRR